MLLPYCSFRVTFLLLNFSLLQFTAYAQNRERQLVIRIDDLGAAHAVNEACIATYKNGIATSAEVMVPTPWFMEAAKMLNENSGLDVGVHLTLTSEWEHVKWRPLTPAKSFVDENGYFFPMTGRNENFPPNSSFFEADWDIKEVEQELRAQIEMAMANINNVTHLSTHMGVARATPGLRELTAHLAEEYGLLFDPTMKRVGKYKQSQDTPTAERIDNFIQILENLEPGTWLFVEHPAYDTPEMQAIHHKGYEKVAADRQAVTGLLTDERVKAAIKEKGIRLVSYGDLRKSK